MSLHLHADTLRDNTISCSEGDTVNKVERSFPAPSLLLFVYLSITLMLGQSLIHATAASSMNLVWLIYHVCTKLNRVRQNACIFTQNVYNFFLHIIIATSRPLIARHCRQLQRQSVPIENGHVSLLQDLYTANGEMVKLLLLIFL